MIAVTGLAGHAFGSWKDRETGCMWLQDLLPKDVEKVRVMTYGYDSNIDGEKMTHQFIDYKRKLVHTLIHARRSCEVCTCPHPWKRLKLRKTGLMVQKYRQD